MLSSPVIRRRTISLPGVYLISNVVSSHSTLRVSIHNRPWVFNLTDYAYAMVLQLFNVRPAVERSFASGVQTLLNKWRVGGRAVHFVGWTGHLAKQNFLNDCKIV